MPWWWCQVSVIELLAEKAEWRMELRSAADDRDVSRERRCAGVVGWSHARRCGNAEYQWTDMVLGASEAADGFAGYTLRIPLCEQCRWRIRVNGFSTVVVQERA